jgi:hypothetical protein
MITREEAQQVLDALAPTYKMDLKDPQFQAVKILCTALAQPEPEPVAWVDWDEHGDAFLTIKDCGVPLYTAPPQRDEASAKAAEWQGLTRGDADSLRVSYTKNGFVQVDALLMRVDEMLRERNT